MGTGTAIAVAAVVGAAAAAYGAYELATAEGPDTPDMEPLPDEPDMMAAEEAARKHTAKRLRVGQQQGAASTALTSPMGLQGNTATTATQRLSGVKPASAATPSPKKTLTGT